MSEKLTDAEVDECIQAVRDDIEIQFDNFKWHVKTLSHPGTIEVLRHTLYERRIAALDAVLAERRERKNSNGEK